MHQVKYLCHDYLNKYNTGEKITNVYFLKNMLGFKLEYGLELELKELNDYNP